MFGISMSEILLILIISLLIFGPEHLPSIARKLGKLVATLRNFSTNIRQQIYEQSGFEQFNNIKQEMQSALEQLKQQITPLKAEQHTDFMTEDELLYSEYQFFYQPELDFYRQPELFDDESST